MSSFGGFGVAQVFPPPLVGHLGELRRGSPKRGTREGGKPARPAAQAGLKSCTTRAGLPLLLLIVAGPFAALALGIAIMRGRPPAAPPPIAAGALKGANVLLVTVDALRADHIGVYGNTGSLTPAIDELAKQGVVFARTYAHTPKASDSQRSLLSADYPNRADASGTLAGALKAAGYRTAAFVSSSDPAARSGLADGFDLFDDPSPGGSPRRAEQVFEAAFPWIVTSPQSQAPSPQPRASSPQSVPWFAWIQLSDPTAPYEPPDPMRAQYAAEPYDGEIAYVDQAFAAFTFGLRRDDALSNTIVIIAGDCGESLGEHGEAGHGALAYDATLRVPLIIWARPGIGPGVFAETMRLVDIAPTLLDVLGIASLARANGRSVRPFIGGGQPFDNRESYFEADGIRGIVRRQDKLIVGRSRELYDLGADPGETNDLYRADDPRVRELQAILDQIAKD